MSTLVVGRCSESLVNDVGSILLCVVGVVLCFLCFCCFFFFFQAEDGIRDRDG